MTAARQALSRHEAILWAARHGGWVLDRTYTGKAFASLLGAARDGRFGADDAVVFWHTGGQPAVFSSGGSVSLEPIAPPEDTR